MLETNTTYSFHKQRNQRCTAQGESKEGIHISSKILHETHEKSLHNSAAAARAAPVSRNFAQLLIFMVGPDCIKDDYKSFFSVTTLYRRKGPFPRRSSTYNSPFFPDYSPRIWPPTLLIHPSSFQLINWCQHDGQNLEWEPFHTITTESCSS